MRYIVGDVETASLEGGVCDIALAEIDEDFNVLWSLSSLVDPECPISPEASGVHHIVDEMVENEPTIDEFMELHSYPLRIDDLVFIGHNCVFDTRVLAKQLPKNYRTMCTLKLARSAWPEAENHKLQTLRYKFKLDAGPEAHRAMGDVLTCIDLLRVLAIHHKTNLIGLAELARKPMSLEAKMPFGKHKGLPLRNLPKNYVDWLLNKTDNLDPDLREALAAMP